MDEELSEVQAQELPVADEVQSDADVEAVETEDTETDAEVETSEDGEATEQEKPKKRSGLDRLKRQLAETRAELELERRSRQAQPVSFDEAVAQEIGQPPKEDDFSTWFEYERAMNAYETDKRLVSRELKRKDAEAQAHHEARRQAAYDDFLDREADVSASIPDYQSAIDAAAAAGMQVSDTIVRALIESDKGPLLRYYLAKNPAEVKSLNAMDPVSAAMALGRLEQRLSKPTGNRATKAQTPVAPVKGGAGPMTDDAKIDAYMERLYGKRGGNKR